MPLTSEVLDFLMREKRFIFHRLYPKRKVFAAPSFTVCTKLLKHFSYPENCRQLVTEITAIAQREGNNRR